MNINQQIAKLKQQPIFYMSQASKELFHSNFLFWLSIININFFNKILGLKNVAVVKREVNGKKINQFMAKADIVCYSSSNEKLYVIETKVKDIPNKPQLDNLEESFGNNIKYILLSFTNPEFKLNKSWTYFSFKELQESMSQNLINFNFNDYEKCLITDYIEYIKNLSTVMEQIISGENYDFSFKKNKQTKITLEEIKMWQYYQRQAGKKMEIKIKEMLSSIPELKTFSGITTQKVAINFFFEWNSLKIGIQIEDNQYRKYIHCEKAHSYADSLRDKQIWFNRDFKLKKGKNKGYSYGSFNMKNNSHFLYQYDEQFYKNCEINFDELKSKIEKDLNEIFSKKLEVLTIFKNN